MMQKTDGVKVDCANCQHENVCKWTKAMQSVENEREAALSRVKTRYLGSPISLDISCQEYKCDKEELFSAFNGFSEEQEGINTVGENVALYRRRAKMTQAELADSVGVTSGFISMLETGRTGVSSKVLKKIAETLGVSNKKEKSE